MLVSVCDPVRVSTVSLEGFAPERKSVSEYCVASAFLYVCPSPKSLEMLRPRLPNRWRRIRWPERLLPSVWFVVWLNA